MNSNFRAGRVAIAVLAGALALSACGGDSTTSDTSASPSESVSVTADETLAAQVPEAVKSTGKLTFGTDASYAPSEFFAEDGSTITGFDVDLGKAIAAKLGLEGVFENASFDALIVGVTNGKWPASMSSFTINPDRLKQVNMISYFDAGTGWAVQSGNPKGISIDNACGRTVAVQKATVQVPDIQDKDKTCKADGNAGIDIQQYSLQADATTAVVSGKADAMLADSPVVAYAIQQAPQLEQLGDIYGTAPYGIVVPKEETDFADAIRGAVQSLIDDGTYMQILDQWGVSNGAIPTSEVNPSVG